MLTPLLLTFACIQTIVTIIVISFNLIGLYLLHKPNTYEYSQKVCLMQLSIIKVVFLIAQNIPFLLDVCDVDPTVTTQVWLLIFCALVVPWCNIMFVLTTDHFIQVVLNTRQQSFYLNTRNTTRFVLILCWFVGAICYIATTFAKDVFKINSLRIIHMYVIQIYHVVIVVTFLCTYLCIFYRYKHNKRKSSEYCSNIRMNVPVKEKVESISKTSKKVRGNLTAIFIVMTYILFVMIPEFLHYSMFHGEEVPNNTTSMSLASIILFDFAGLSECLLYIFMNASTKKNFKRMVDFKTKRRKFSVVISTRHEIKVV